MAVLDLLVSMNHYQFRGMRTTNTPEKRKNPMAGMTSASHLCCNDNCYCAVVENLFAFINIPTIVYVSFFLGILMYWMNVALPHLHTTMIVESSKPGCAAVVVEPIIKLSPVSCFCGWPSCSRYSLTALTNHLLVNELPFVDKKWAQQ